MSGGELDPAVEATTPPPAAVDPTGETAPQVGRAWAPPDETVVGAPGAPVLETRLEPASGPPPQEPPRSGEGPGRILGEFELVEELARGGMGVVWIARSRRLGRRVALKLLHREDVGPEGLERFQIEARAAARLRHPNIVGVHEVGEADGAPFLAMDLIEGQSLQARLKKTGPLPAREAARIAALLARALAFAHQAGVLHRDVKPANVLLDQAGEPVLGDFGLAKELEAPSGSPTRTGQLMGTPAYMSPEQVRGELDQVDRRADVWALGATLYEALTGRVPFLAGTTPGLLLKILREDPPAPRRLRPELDRDLETVVLRCLEKEPEARYPSAQALAEDLERWLSDLPIAARRPGPLERLRKWARRNRATATALVGAAALLVALGAAGGVLHVRRLEHARAAAEQRAQVALEALRVLTRTAEQELRQIQDPRARAMRAELLQAALHGARALRALEREGAEGDAPALLRVATAGRLAAELENELGRREAARASLAEAEAAVRALVRRSPTPLARRELSMVVDLRGKLHRAAGEVPAARAAWEESRVLAEALLRESPGETTARRDVAIALAQLSRLEADDGDAARALELAREAVRARRALCARSPVGPEELADALVLLSGAQHVLGDGPAALAAASEGVVWARQALLRGSTPLRRHYLLAALNAVGRAWHLLQDHARGRAAQREGRLMAEAQLAADPGSIAAKELLATLLEAEGALAWEEGAADEAVGLAVRGVALRRELLAWDAGEREPARHLVQSLLVLARAGLGLEHTQDAVAAAGEAVSLARGLVRGPEDAAVRAELGEALDLLGRAHTAHGAGPAAAAALEEALALRRELAGRPDASAEVRRDLLVALEHLGDLRGAQGGPLLEEAVGLARARASAPGARPEASSDLALLLCKLANHHQDAGRPAAAAACFREAATQAQAAARVLPAWAGRAQALLRQVRLMTLVEADAPGDPATPAAHLSRAFALAVRGEVAAAFPHFRAALEDQAVRADLELRNLRCAAQCALAAGQAAPALDWLREDTARRQAALLRVREALLRAPDRATQAALEAEREALEITLRTLGEDETYQALWTDPGFQAVVRAARGE